jgi:hypothetical protein
MPTYISVSKVKYGYLITVQRSGYREFTEVVGSDHPAAAAEATIAAWQDMRADPDGVTVTVPPEVETVLQSIGPIPWLLAPRN